MHSTRTIHVISAHAEGEVGDVIVGGVAPPPGDTLWEQSRFIARDKTLRNFVLNEPRGGVFRHVNLLVPPRQPEAAAAFIIMEPEDTPPMSGSNAICVSTVLLDGGIIPMQEPVTEFTLEAPGGLVRVRAECQNGKARRIFVENLPSFAQKIAVPLEVEGDPLSFERVPIAPPVLESVMVHNRPRLQAALAVYEQAEVDVDLAYLYRWPWFGVGPAYEREAESNDPVNERVGVNLTIVNVPVFNQNQGQIAITEARRERLRLDFAARVHEGRAELHEAIRNLRAQESLIDLFHARIRPALEENASLTEAGFEMHEFNLVQLITTQDLVLRNRREFVRAQLEHGKAIYDLERAIGAPVAPPR